MKAMKIMHRFDTATETESEISNISHDNIEKYIDHFHVRIGIDQHTFLITSYCEVISVFILFSSFFKIF
jgi:hypothetical protein